MNPTSLLEEDRKALEKLRRAREPRLDALRADTHAALDVVARATRRETKAAESARQALRDALRQDARFLLDDPEYQSFRASAMRSRATRRKVSEGALVRLRQPDLRVGFERCRRAIEEDYNDEEYYLVRTVTTRVSVGTQSGDVSVQVARRFVRDVRFVRTRLDVDEIHFQLDDVVSAALDVSSANAAEGRRASRPERLDEDLRAEVGAMLLFAIPLLRPAPRKVRLPWP